MQNNYYNEETQKKTIDARGKVCPTPVIWAKRAMEEGFLQVSILVDNLIATQNLKKLADAKGFGTEVSQNEHGYLVMLASGVATSSADPSRSAQSSADPSRVDPSRVDQSRSDSNRDDHKGDAQASKLQNAGNMGCNDARVVIISSDCMGSGDEALGKTLMKTFLYTLNEHNPRPGTILLYNSGIKLACGESQSVDDLKNLEAAGVRIMSCGACLNFYELTQSLAVGSVTNMYEIISIMASASSVIRP